MTSALRPALGVAVRGSVWLYVWAMRGRKREKVVRVCAYIKNEGESVSLCVGYALAMCEPMRWLCVRIKKQTS